MPKVVLDPEGGLQVAKLSKQVWEMLVPVYVPVDNSEHTHTDGFWPFENASQLCRNDNTYTTGFTQMRETESHWQFVHDLFVCFDEIFKCKEIKEWNELRWHWPQVSERPVFGSYGNAKQIRLKFTDDNEPESNTLLIFEFEIHREDHMSTVYNQPTFVSIKYNSPIALYTKTARQKIETAMREPRQSVLRGDIIQHSFALDANVSQYII
jgi:hypothetical protein